MELNGSEEKEVSEAIAATGVSDTSLMSVKETSSDALPQQSATATRSETNHNHSCIGLVKGDLVRISERGFREVKKLRDRGDALGRILDTHNDGTLYDIEWLVEGGTSTRIAHYYLWETTPESEGLTVTRRREKRKPKSFSEDAIAMDTAKAERRAGQKSNTVAKKVKISGKEQIKQAASKGTKKITPSTDKLKKATSKKAPVAKQKQKKAPVAKVTNSKKAQTLKRKAPEVSQAGKKRKLSARETNKPETSMEEEDSVDATASVVPKGMDLYEKQRREFDRVMARLEKIDRFNWFWDPVPPDFDENYEDTDTKISQSAEASNEKDDVAGGDTSEKAEQSSKVAPSPASPYPDFAPYNWEMIRRRKANGRYESDRIAVEEKEYLELMKPYYRATGRRLPYKRKKISVGKKNLTPSARVLYPVGVNWELFRNDVTAMIDAVSNRVENPAEGGHGSVEAAAKKLREALEQAVERTGRRQEKELRYYDDRHRFDAILRQQPNEEAAMQSWRTTPFPERRYERLTSDVVSAGLSELDERTASYELKTSLPDSFIGLSYRYDDTGQSEAWMQSVVEEAEAKRKGKGANQAKKAALALESDEGVVQAQVVATMQSLLIAVQDKVMTDMAVLHQRELRSANWFDSEDSTMQLDIPDHCSSQSQHHSEGSLSPEIVEQPVWGIDCYTRRNIAICLESEFDTETSLTFVEKWLLPAINACPPDIAHDISNAARILEGLPFQVPSDEDRLAKLEDENESKSVHQWSHTILGNALVNKIKKQSPPWLKAAANLIRRARESLGPNFFRVHPKGHGSVLLSQRVEPNRLVTFYRGEVYPAWRWGEKMDAIEITQERKGLRPTLPDFYNMALERPQTDPRGYGLLFVDASRKAGHGSSVSHSCQPTCEVRVSALDGELCLAMTTLRQLEMGEELTFDYNAATDSLNEYQSAVCLCGHGKCRGSFLHFATADCYQKVMNRNCPIASRFANLIKGCMKKVMSEDDEKVLQNHGFRTASFGAISVNRRDTFSANKNLSDTMDIVPVWLRTYVADTLRYIEYERRALPITLICDQMPPGNDEDEEPTPRSTLKEPVKPENTFLFFSRRQSDRIGKLLKEKGVAESGLSLQSAKQKVAAAYWNTFSDEKKDYWRQEAIKDFERKKEEWQAQERHTQKKNANKNQHSEQESDEKSTAKQTIGFQDADAEGVSAMEHRIQHLTQALSRVGRVLDRHRELQLQNGEINDARDTNLRDVVHSPLVVLSDTEVVQRLWDDEDSLVKALSTYIYSGDCVSGELRKYFAETVAKYSALLSGGKRKTLKCALLELRAVILENLQAMAKLFRKHKAQLNSQKSASQEQVSGETTINEQPKECPNSEEEHRENGEVVFGADTDDDDVATTAATIRTEVRLVLDGMLDKVDSQSKPEKEKNPSSTSLDENEPLLASDELMWIEHYGKRVSLEAAADLLLMYANTSNFFVINPYAHLHSTPIEVYARELGNSVPKTAIDPDLANDQDSDPDVSQSASNIAGKHQNDLCSPDDVVAKVTVHYSGDYVVSQLLQWYNGGIGLKPGLPDLSGCVILPHISGCWSSSLVPKKKIRSDKKTVYDARIRLKLVEWLQDPFKRGDPFPEEVKQAFSSEMHVDRPVDRILLGSPVLDFLVMGDESSIYNILDELDSNNKVSARDNKIDNFSTVDKGRPAQAVCRWVQCENPKCLKWRRIPWHVDIDLLPEKFFCKDNQWDPSKTSCSIPEDDWDADDKLVGSDGKVEGSPIRKKGPASPSEEASFRVGAKFDVCRTVKGKNKFTVATVTHVDFSGKVKRVKFHYRKTTAEADEWVEFGSDRIAMLYSKTGDPATKKDKAEGKHSKQRTDTHTTGSDSRKMKSNSKDAKKIACHTSMSKQAKQKHVEQTKGDAIRSKASDQQGKDLTSPGDTMNHAEVDRNVASSNRVFPPAFQKNSSRERKICPPEVNEIYRQVPMSPPHNNLSAGTSHSYPLLKETNKSLTCRSNGEASEVCRDLTDLVRGIVTEDGIGHHDGSTPSSENAGPRQVTAEKSSPVVSKLHAQSPLMEPRTNDVKQAVIGATNPRLPSIGFDEADTGPAQQVTPSWLACQSIPSPPTSSPEPLRGAPTDCSDVCSPAQSTQVTGVVRHHLSTGAPFVPEPGFPGAADPRLLTALVIAQQSGDPTIVMQLRQLLQNPQLYRK